MCKLCKRAWGKVDNFTGLAAPAELQKKICSYELPLPLLPSKAEGKKETFHHYKLLGKMKYHFCWAAECTHRFGIGSGDSVCVEMMEIPPSLGEHQRKVSCWCGGFFARLLRRCSMCVAQPLLSKHRVLLSHPLIWWMCVGVTTREQGSPPVPVLAAVLFVLARHCFLSGSAERGKFPGGKCCFQGILHGWRGTCSCSIQLCAGARRMSLQAFPPLWLQPLFKGFSQEQIFLVT